MSKQGHRPEIGAPAVCTLAFPCRNLATSHTIRCCPESVTERQQAVQPALYLCKLGAAKKAQLLQVQPMQGSDSAELSY